MRAEVPEFLPGHVHLLDDKGRQRLVRHGFLPKREVLTGIGKVPVHGPRVRDRGVNLFQLVACPGLAVQSKVCGGIT